MKLEEYKKLTQNYIDEKNEDFGLYGPLFRKENDKLCLGYMIMEVNDNNRILRPRYWLLQDISNGNIIEFNDIKDKDFVSAEILPLDKTFSIGDNSPIDMEVRHIKYSFLLWSLKIIDNIEETNVNKDNEIYLDEIFLDNNNNTNMYNYLKKYIDDITKKISNTLKDEVEKKLLNAFYDYDNLIFDNIISDYLDKNIINLELIEKNMYLRKYVVPDFIELINAFNNISGINTEYNDNKIKNFLGTLLNSDEVIPKLIDMIDEKLANLEQNNE